MAQSGWASSNSPFDTTLKFGGLIELGGQIEKVDFGGCTFSVRYDNKRVDFEICELAVDVNGVQSCYEVNENIVDTFGDLFQQCARNLLV